MRFKKLFVAILIAAMLPLSMFSCSKEKAPQVSDWVGNVFQIITYDVLGNPVASGTGVVIDKTGKFITNAHVIETAVTAEAIFEIEDSAAGLPYTYLDITHGYVYEQDKDIFIGYIDNYNKVGKNHYKDVVFTDSHKNGEPTYSIGYPNSVPNMEIHKGKITQNISSLYDKLVRGSAYIGSTSYIAPGSSGGILVNNKCEIVGITSRGQEDANGNFVVGAAITYKSFKGLINSSTKTDLKTMIHGEYKRYIDAFLNFMDLPNVESVVASKLYMAEINHRTYDWGTHIVKAQLYAYPVASSAIVLSAELIYNDGTTSKMQLRSTWNPNTGFSKGTFTEVFTTTVKFHGITYSPGFTYVADYTYSNGEMYFSNTELNKNNAYVVLGLPFGSDNIETLKQHAQTCYNYAKQLVP